MGRYYALHDGEDAEVATAIAEHYAPAGASDTCSTAPVSIAVALADKIDTLVGFWLNEEKPSGSKDPYALRRAALGVIRTIIENGLRIQLINAFLKTEELNPPAGDIVRDRIAKSALPKNVGLMLTHAPRVSVSRQWRGSAGTFTVNTVLLDLLSFFVDRLKVHLRDKGIKHDLIDAVFALPGQDDLVLIVARVNALEEFLASDDGANLLTAYKRASNILKIEEKRDKTGYTGEPDPALFQQDEERALHAAIAKVIPEAVKMAEKEDFTGAMTALARLRGPVDAFFDHVTVNADDEALRKNRLLLLSEIRTALERLADFSKIEG
jgi:glycyl-tRNA synthetase beta chain